MPSFLLWFDGVLFAEVNGKPIREGDKASKNISHRTGILRSQKTLSTKIPKRFGIPSKAFFQKVSFKSIYMVYKQWQSSPFLGKEDLTKSFCRCYISSIKPNRFGTSKG